MKTSQVIATTLLTVLAAVGAHAETYGGVHPAANGRTSADVASEANRAASAGNAYGEAASAGVAPALAASKDSAAARNEAVAHAHRPNQNLDGKAFVNSVVPSQYTNGSLKIRTTSQAGN
jgi:hypothetical protein